MLVISEAVDKSVYLTNDGAGNLILTDFYLEGKVLGAAVGDIDHNGLLDIIAVKGNVIDIYESQYVKERGETEEQDQPPSKIKGMPAFINNGKLNLQWIGADDDLTPSSSLTYEVVIGTKNGLWNILPGEIGPAQTTLQQGNVINSTKVVVDLPLGIEEVHYGVQAVDSELK